MNGAARGIAVRSLFAYAVLGVATKALTLPLISYLPPFYAQQSGVSLALVGVLFMVARFWDILIDPAIGYVMDRSNPRFGRRKFWIGVAVPILMATIWPLFVPGTESHVVRTGMILFLFYIGWTILTISHASWPADLSRRSADRVRLIGWREWAGVIGMISTVLVPMAVAGGAQLPLAAQLRAMALYILVLLPLAAGLTLFLLPSAVRTAADKPRLSDSWRLIATSRPLRALLLADLLAGAAYATNSATAYFIMADYLGLGAQYSLVMLCIMLGMIVGVPVLMRLGLTKGRRYGYCVVMIGAACATLSLGLVPHKGLVLAMIVNGLLGFFTGGYQFNLNAAMVDLADGDRKTSGRDGVSLHLALLAMTNKIGYALAVGVVYNMLGGLGYAAGHPTASGTAALLLVSLILPALMFLGSALAFVAAERHLGPADFARTAFFARGTRLTGSRGLPE